MALIPIQDCKEGNCRFHFPQFDGVNPVALGESMRRIIEDSKNKGGYFARTYGKYGNVESTVSICHAVLALLPFDVVTACDIIEIFASSERAKGNCVYLDSGYYADKRGGVAKFMPCCR